MPKSSYLAELPNEVFALVHNNANILLRTAEADAITTTLLSSYQHDALADNIRESDEDKNDTQGQEDRNQNVRVSVPNKVVVRGMGGTGKSTLAAIVASKQSIRQKFDTIFWIDVGKSLFSTDCNETETKTPARNNLTYDRYRECLRDMCRHLKIATDGEGIHRKFNDEVVRSPGDQSMQVASKYLRAMLAARCEMARVLDGRRNTLVILDDVWSHEDIDLFNFNENASPHSGDLSILITTRTIDKTPLPQTFALSLGLLNEHDAIHLIGLEIGLPRHFDFEALSVADRSVLSEIIKKCGYLPLAIRMLGKTIKAYAGIIPFDFSVDKLLRNIMMGWDNQQLDGSNPSVNISLYDTLDRTFSMVVTSTESSNFIKLCFGALAVTFAQDDYKRPWTSLRVVEQLWTAMMESQNEYNIELLKRDGLTRGDDVRRILETGGAIDIMMLEGSNSKKTKYIQISHDLLWECGKQYLEINSQLGLTKEEDKPYFSIWPWRKLSIPADNIERKYNEITIFLNRQISYIYKEMMNGTFFSDDGHMFLFYPRHLIKGDLLPDSYQLLNNPNFIACRLQGLGMVDGVKNHMQDIVLLHKEVLKVKRMPEKYEIDYYNITDLINSIVFAVVSFNSTIHSIHDAPIHFTQIENVVRARGLIKIGLAIQGLHLWNIAMDCFTKALQQLKFANLPVTHPDMKCIAKCIEAVTLRPVRLVPKKSSDILVLKYGAVLRARTKSCGVPLELISHPGHGIVPMTSESEYLSSWGSFCFLGISTSESSIQVQYDGDFITRVDDGTVMNVSAGWLYEGMALAIVPGPKNESERKKQLKMTNGSRRFIINHDGTISVANRPDLVLGISRNPNLYLVDRYSPNRAIFKNVEKIRQSSNDSKEIEDCDGIKLELKSHAPYTIMPINKDVLVNDIFQSSFRVLGLGPSEDALQVIYRKNKIIVRNHNNYFLSLHFPGHFAGNGVNIVGSALDSWLTIWFVKIWTEVIARKLVDFSINNDGTISPLNAPHLVLGFQIPDFCNLRDMPVTTYTKDPLKDDGMERKSSSTSILTALIVFFW
eukprot:CAMPEP_0194270880 /NCGR_PEP_ID=MMETSP0169-20130528/4788_1 /TAXON_ID=218684 /ORGANISM="Corethron pennatum, Strain L29A3" /LENGTH=1053 /DNA_ID=CAMNT_0039013083 /DNA_START=309 /DNA_END=3467 /DNA_ORIENTATION=+